MEMAEKEGGRRNDLKKHNIGKLSDMELVCKIVTYLS
jgi:hypothetical protein